MSGIVLLIVKEALPMVIGPMVTALVKWLTEKFGKTLPSIAKVAVSVTAGAATAITTGDVSTITGILSDAVVGGIGGMAGSKGRDMIAGKTEVISTATLNTLAASEPMSNDKLKELMGG